MIEKPFSMVEPSFFGDTPFSLRDNLLFKTASDFSHFVEMAAVAESKTCTEVILEYCNEKGIDEEEISKLVSTSLKGKIQQEMIESGLLDGHNTLDGF